MFFWGEKGLFSAMTLRNHFLFTSLADRGSIVRKRSLARLEPTAPRLEEMEEYVISPFVDAES